MKQLVVNWPLLQIQYIKPDEWNKKIAFLIEHKYSKHIGDFSVRRYETFINQYSIVEKRGTIELKFIENGTPVKYRCDKGNTGNADSNITGFECYKEVEHIWQQKNNTSSTLFRTFSGRKYAEVYKKIKKCVPIQISFIDSFSVGKATKRSNCFKADVSSAFPYQMTKDIPTLKDSKEIKGIAEPTPEFPFAFYLRSHHMKIYNELDTHNLKHKYYPKYDEVYDDSVAPQDEVTILCKRGKNSLATTFEYLYAHRNENSDNKLYMNATIGFFHKNTDPTLSHIAATVIARNNMRMINYARTLEHEGNYVLYIATDCIVWQGHESKIATEDKHLGTFTYEGKNGRFFGWMVGSYQYIDGDGTLTTKSSYIDNGPAKDRLKFGELPPPGHSHEIGYLLDPNGKIIEI